MLLNLVVVLSLYAFVISIAEIGYAVGVNDFVVRKIAHIACGMVTALLPVFLDLKFAIIAGVLLAVFVAVSRFLKIFKGIESTDKYSWGTLYFPIGFVIAAIVFWPLDPVVFRGAALILGFADGGAALVGKFLGKKKYLNGSKTILGSTAFYLITCVISLLIFDYARGGIEEFTLLSGLILLVGAGVVTAFEAFSKKGLDNIFIPAAAGTLLFLLLR